MNSFSIMSPYLVFINLQLTVLSPAQAILAFPFGKKSQETRQNNNIKLKSKPKVLFRT